MFRVYFTQPDSGHYISMCISEVGVVLKETSQVKLRFIRVNMFLNSLNLRYVSRVIVVSD